MIYLEEAAFMALDVFFEVVVPLLEMETTALIAISTPLDGLNVSNIKFRYKKHPLTHVTEVLLRDV